MMKKSLSTDICNLEHNEKIQKMFDTYDREVKAIVIFFVLQFLFWCFIIWG